jgi:hypothetical protein
MAKFLQFPSQPFGRPAWIDPDRVSAIVDCVEMRQGQIAGGRPSVAITGTNVIVDGQAVTLVGEPAPIAAAIEKGRTAATAMLVG